MNVHDYLEFVIIPILIISVILVFIRFSIGPTLADRVVALDLLITIGIGIITCYSIIKGKDTLLDIAMIFALIAFLGTVAFSYHMERSEKKQ